jgi:4-amino-4-deoxy-L-arabinose transferase-like glycosyltransferase
VVDDRWWLRGLIAVGCLALGLRVLLIVLTPHFGLSGDPADYQRHAASIASGYGYPTTQYATPGTPSAYRPPAYPYLLGGVYAVFGIHPNIGRLLGALLGTATVLLTAWLGARLSDRRIGLIAGAVAAVCPSLIVLNGSLLTESLFLPIELGLAIVLLMIRQSGPSLHLGLLAGALCAVAGDTRTVGILFLLPALVAILWQPVERRVRLGAVAALLLACVLVLTPWTVRNAEVFHAFVPLDTEGGPTLAGQYNAEAGTDNGFEAVDRVFPSQTPQLARQMAPLYSRPGGVNEVELNSKLTSAALTYLKRHPIHLLIASALDTLRMFDLGKGHTFVTNLSYESMNVPSSLRRLTTLFIQLITIIALVGLIARLTRRRWMPQLGTLLVWSLPLLVILSTVPTGGTPRYRVIADPFLILLATLTIVGLCSRFGSGSGGADLPASSPGA